ncbi:hypothetical protein PG993_009160 [Apiospora rasikravindrae]|uniref:C6 finger domain protein n=1 Tax=Apiospora rasikravindrae TaxID=990691 RepID=A0ABR1SIK6_9PEZI
MRSLAVRGKSRPRPPPTSAIWVFDEATSFQLDAKCQEFVDRYLGRSLITPADPDMRQVNRNLLILAFHHPYLMHASIAVALAYDRHLNPSPGCRRTLEESYHWSQSTALLNKRLKEPIKTKDKDPIWGTAAALAVLSFSSLDASTPEESWPLKPPNSTDLEWLRMGKGKMSLWDLANPLRPDSIFSIMAPTYAHMYAPLPERDLDGIPRALATVCGLDSWSTAETNPYLHAAHAVSQIQNLPDAQVTIGQMERFTRSIQGPFECLLREKDPVALLLLYLWYRKAGRCIWWIGLRARIECPSICAYLRLYHAANCAVLAFLPGGRLVDKWNQARLPIQPCTAAHLY